MQLSASCQVILLNINPVLMKRNIISCPSRAVKVFLAPMLYILTSSVLSAQKSATSGVAAFKQASDALTQYFDPLVTLIYVVGAVVGLIGAIKVYQKFSQGDPDTGKTAASWFGACIFLVISATVLRAFFL